MRVILVDPGESARVMEIDLELKSLWLVLDGYIELFAIDGHVACICNEEGRIRPMPFNRVFTLTDGSAWDIYGPLLLVGINAGGMFESLTDDDIARWLPKYQ